jgi:hypothetical protein
VSSLDLGSETNTDQQVYYRKRYGTLREETRSLTVDEPLQFPRPGLEIPSMFFHLSTGSRFV